MHRRGEASAAHRAQRIAGEGAATRAKLDIMAVGAVGAVPQVGEREADQLAEHLADFRRGGEIAARAERVAGGVIMGVGRTHILRQRDRPGERDRARDPLGQRAVDVGRVAHAIV